MTTKNLFITTLLRHTPDTAEKVAEVVASELGGATFWVYKNSTSQVGLRFKQLMKSCIVRTHTAPHLIRRVMEDLYCRKVHIPQRGMRERLVQGANAKQ